MTIGRNDACPCGSGKKFKKCHGASAAAEAPRAARANTLKALDADLVDRLMRFARQRHGPDWLQDVLDSEGMLVDGIVPNAEMPIVIPWLEHFRVDEATALTLADEWLAHSHRISSDERLLLAAYEEAWMSIWEITEVEPGVGSRLRDVLTGEERFVDDVRSSMTMERFDSVLAIIVTCDGVSFFGGAHGQPLPPRHGAMAAQEARRFCRVRTRAVARAKLQETHIHQKLLVLWRAAVDELMNAPAPVLHNTDGDPFVQTKDDFSLLADRDEVAARLASLPGVEDSRREGDSIVFVVVKHGNSTHGSLQSTVIARIALREARLTVETNSARRADSLRRAVESHLPGMVRFRVRKEENTARLIASAREASPERGGGATAQTPLPPETAAALREFRERHMRDWLDQSIPLLDGLTPREAAKLPRARSKLEVLLKEIEQMEARLPPEQQIDVAWVREELLPHGTS